MSNHEVSLFVGGVNIVTSIQDVKNFFCNFSSYIKSVKLFQGFAFVHFINAAEADRAIYELHKTILCGHPVTVERRYNQDDTARNSHISMNLDSRSSSDMRDYKEPKDFIYRVKVCNLAETVTWRVLKNFMQQAGEVIYADCQRYSSDMGVVHFSKRKYMVRALQTLNGQILHNQSISLHSPKTIPNKYALHCSFNSDKCSEKIYAEKSFYRNEPTPNRDYSYHNRRKTYHAASSSDAWSKSYKRSSKSTIDNEVVSYPRSRSYAVNCKQTEPYPAESFPYPTEVHYPPKTDNYRREKYASRANESHYSRSRSPINKRFKSSKTSDRYTWIRKDSSSSSRKDLKNKRRKEFANSVDDYDSEATFERTKIASVVEIRRKERPIRKSDVGPDHEHKGPRTPSYTPPPRELSKSPSVNLSFMSISMGNPLSSSSPKFAKE